MVRPRGRDDAEPAFNGAEQAAATGVIGVLAQELDSARNPEANRIIGARSKIAQRTRGQREQGLLATRFGGAESDRRESFAERAQSVTSTARSRAATAGMSAR